MYIGTQFGCRHDTDIQVLAQLGVMHVDQTPAEPWQEWTADSLEALRDRFARYGIELEMIHVPLSARSALVDEAGAIFRGPGEARDRQIERMCETVRMAAAAGLRGINYNITLLGHLRTAPALRARRGHALLLRAGQSSTSRAASSRAARPTRTPCGSGSTTGCATSSRWPRSTASRWRATRRTRASATASSTAGWPASWAWRTGSRS